MLFSDFKNSIPLLQQANLGGITAQFQLAPAYRKKYDLDKIKANNPIKASVLIILFPNSMNEACFVLTKRADYNGHHSKQISFPGGKQNIDDKSLLDTALRETYEEIGVTIKSEYIFKKLTEVYIPPSNFLVHPFLAILDTTPKFKTNYEVASIITPKISDLLDLDNQKEAQVQTTNGKVIDTAYFALENETVWGATAMMLSEFRDLIYQLD
jgi:8-oxo-dGTP pyrophosphatase MutT (NUDIX family)